jgi:spore coat polysaccharide biosynthesis protein SpsF
MQNVSSLIVVQCRYNSRRLPGKAMYPLSGVPILVFLLRRLRSHLPVDEYKIVLATTRGRCDDVIAAWGAREDVHVFRGEENDVLGRYAKCLARHPSETIVRITADNPLTCPEMLRRIVRVKRERHIDYIQCENLPHGVGADAFSAGALSFLNREVRDADEREHINLNILRNPGKFKIFSLNVEGELARPDLRMTVDTKEDWRRVDALFNPEETEPWKITLYEAVERMDKTRI